MEQRTITEQMNNTRHRREQTWKGRRKNNVKVYKNRRGEKVTRSGFMEQKDEWKSNTRPQGTEGRM